MARGWLRGPGSGAAALAALLAGAGLAAAGFFRDRPPLYFAGSALALAGTAWLSWLAFERDARVRGFALNTLACAILGLHGIDAFLALGPSQAPGARVPAYSFAAAEGNPAAARAWWDAYLGEWLRAERQFMRRSESGYSRYRLVPGARARFFGSEVRINALGFRGPEISREKGGAFRIVALGESSTFGVTLTPQDRPWPELLEARLSELGCGARFEVVNAGVPAWTLADNLARLRRDVLPLEPDLVLSYHGYNALHWLSEDLPEIDTGPPAMPPSRPSRLLARVEASLWRSVARRSFEGARLAARRLGDAELLETRYARVYRMLARALERARVPLVLASFNMAVNERSPEAVIRFYEGAFPDARTRIVANALHNRMLPQLASPPAVRFADSSPGMDGHYEDAFVDLIHLTQTGRERLSANLVEALRPSLLAAVRARCAAR